MVSARTGASSRSTALTATRVECGVCHIRIRRVSPGYTTPANRVTYDRTRVTSPPSSVSTTAFSVMP